MENPASPWFAARGPLALPAANSAPDLLPATIEAAQDIAAAFPWFG